ncbi:MAG: ATP-binding protein, partial [Actinomycetota bacterium]|nr:ATP-binding protein [Actinomycetota bacterium]
LDSLLTGGTLTDESRVKGLVAGFLRATGGTHVDGQVPVDPSVAGRGWPSRRSWTNAVKVMSQFHRDDPANLLALTGLVGEGTAIEYVAWKAANDLYDPAEVLADPTKVAWTKERPDRLFALIGAITSMAMGDKSNWAPAMVVLATCAKAGRPDLVTPAARRLFRVMPSGTKMPKVVHSQFVDAFTDLMTSQDRSEYAGVWAS